MIPRSVDGNHLRLAPALLKEDVVVGPVEVLLGGMLADPLGYDREPPPVVGIVVLIAEVLLPHVPVTVLEMQLSEQDRTW